MLLSIDLFSGIGGISYALKGLAATIQYCEWDPFCQQVLAERMRAGDIDRAPVHTDVKTLMMPPAVAVTMITGGFPCQDISSIGLQKGIQEGERSSMFYEIMRLVDECPSVKVLFLENVANILNCGISEVVEECTKRGFDMQWCIRSASGHGAPHVRKRWFCLCVRGDPLFPAVAAQGAIQTSWDEEPVSRATIKGGASYDELWVKRCQTLGNTVVPCVVRAAYLHMSSMHPRWGAIAECFGDLGVPTQPLPRSFPECGLVYKGKVYSLPTPMQGDIPHACEIVIDVPSGVGGEGKEAIAPYNYPTPRRGITHASTLTDRSLRDLPTVLLHTRKAIEEVKGLVPTFDPKSDKVFHLAVPSVNYIEWMMGYPRDWTRVAGAKKVEAKPPPVEESLPPAEPTPTQKTRVARVNGLQVYMSELKDKGGGKDIKSAAASWKAMTDAQREEYSARARAYNALGT